MPRIPGVPLGVGGDPTRGGDPLREQAEQEYMGMTQQVISALQELNGQQDNYYSHQRKHAESQRKFKDKNRMLRYEQDVLSAMQQAVGTDLSSINSRVLGNDTFFMEKYDLAKKYGIAIDVFDGINERLFEGGFKEEKIILLSAEEADAVGKILPEVIITQEEKVTGLNEQVQRATEEIAQYSRLAIETETAIAQVKADIQSKYAKLDGLESQLGAPTLPTEGALTREQVVGLVDWRRSLIYSHDRNLISGARPLGEKWALFLHQPGANQDEVILLNQKDVFYSCYPGDVAITRLPGTVYAVYSESLGTRRDLSIMTKFENGIPQPYEIEERERLETQLEPLIPDMASQIGR